MVLITTGSETLTTALVGTLHYLLENDGKMKRRLREIRGDFSSGAAIYR